MNETLTGFAALALFGFVAGFGMLMLFMVLVQPIWSVVDCAIDPGRGTAGKLLWVLAIGLGLAFALLFHGHVEFRRGIERQWQEHGKVLTVRAAPAPGLAPVRART